MSIDFNWVNLVISILIFVCGHAIGWYRHQEKCEREKREEALRIAITPKNKYITDDGVPYEILDKPLSEVTK